MKRGQSIFVLRDSAALFLGLGCCLLALTQLTGQPATTLIAPVRPAAPNVAANTNAAASLIKSPVDSFRELLAMDVDEREARLAGRDPADRQAILAKLQEYESLAPEERELRLSTTQLQWYMLRFMKTPATNWPAILASVPKVDRALVEHRMNQWVILPPPLQTEILEYESTSRYFGLSPDTIAKTSKVSPPLPENERREVEARLAHWNALPPDDQRRMRDQFNHFFELTPAEKEKTLSSLSEPERAQMEKTLQSFQQLPKATRELCLQSFGRFARMSAYEQQRFLKNAERWREMSPGERDAWKRLVHYLADTPPMPQGLDPLPPGLRLDPHLAAPGVPDSVPLATNSVR
ncbi:MAG: DUF3106 domain-containing protein [Verrucomicrobia bacterium]|nr:DUF3106 domain-containing protein [Verrucomicrobiota bacterium]